MGGVGTGRRFCCVKCDGVVWCHKDMAYVDRPRGGAEQKKFAQPAQVGSAPRRRRGFVGRQWPVSATSAWLFSVVGTIEADLKWTGIVTEGMKWESSESGSKR